MALSGFKDSSNLDELFKCKEGYRIILIINKKTKDRVCNQYCYKPIDIQKSVIEIGKELFIVYKDYGRFKHETVEHIEDFEGCGLKITTTKKIWFIYR